LADLYLYAVSAPIGNPDRIPGRCARLPLLVILRLSAPEAHAWGWSWSRVPEMESFMLKADFSCLALSMCVRSYPPNVAPWINLFRVVGPSLSRPRIGPLVFALHHINCTQARSSYRSQTTSFLGLSVSHPVGRQGAMRKYPSDAWNHLSSSQRGDPFGRDCIGSV